MTVDKPDDPAEEGTLTSDGRSIPTNTFTRIFHADSNASQEGLFRRRNESLHKSLTNYGVFSLQGKRPTMEDAHKAMPRVLLSEIHKDKEIDMKKFQTSVVLDADCDSSHATDNKDTNSKDAPPSSDDTGPDKTRTITSAIDTQTHALGSDTDNDDDIKAQVSSSSSSSSSASSQAHAHAHDLYGFFSVMDGHGGDQCALFVSQTLPSQLFTHAKYKTDVEEALLDSFHSTEALWTDKATKQSLDGGSTALCALFIGSIMYVVNLGDSEAVLCRKNTGISLLKPHNPKKNPEEAKRVVEAGGRLYRNRLGHPVYNPQYFNIAVSRAFGDMMFKDEGFCKVEYT